MTADLINGLLETVGALFVAVNARQLFKDKELKGVRWEPIVFFTSWGVWNLYYYPSLEQWFSFAGGVLLAGANFVWLSQAVYYIYVYPGFQLLRALEGDRAK